MGKYIEDPEDERFECDATCSKMTSQAVFVVMEDGSERWVPKSVIHDDSEVYDDSDNSRGKLVLKGWWAEKQGLA
jgi:hypothetical protein